MWRQAGLCARKRDPCLPTAAIGPDSPAQSTNNSSVLEIVSYQVWLLLHFRDEESTARHSEQNQLLEEAEKS